MTKREIASLACKLLSIYALLSALASSQGSLGTALEMWRFAESQIGGNPLLTSWWIPIAGFAPCFALLLAALLLWMMADFLAVLMTRSSTADSVAVAANLSAREWQAIGFSLFGVWELLQALTNIGRFFFYSAVAQQPSSARSFGWNATAEILMMILTFSLGCALLFGARRLSHILNQVRDSPPPDALN